MVHVNGYVTSHITIAVCALLYHRRAVCQDAKDIAFGLSGADRRKRVMID